MKRFLALSLALLLVIVAVPVDPAHAAGGVRGLEQRMRTERVDGVRQAAEVAPNCANGSCGGMLGGGGNCPGGSCAGELQGLFRGIFDFFRELFRGIASIFKEIFNGGGGGPVAPPPGGGTTGNPPVDGGDAVPPPPGGTTITQDPPIPEPPATPPTPPAPPVTTPPPADGANTPKPPTAGEMPQGSAALVRAIKEKFGVTITGSPTEQKLKYAYETLAILPDSFRKRTTQIQYHNVGGGIAGYVYIPQTTVHLNLGASRRGTLVHEMAHTWQGGNQALTNQWAREINGRSNAFNSGRVSGSVSPYGNTNPLEDMAESVMHYVFYPDKMKQTHKSRYEFVKKHIMSGVEYTGNEFTDWK